MRKFNQNISYYKMSNILGTLDVTVVRAFNVPNADMWLGNSDPYVTLTLNDEKWTTVTADSLTENTSIWNERLVFKISSSEQLTSFLQIELWDKDSIGKDDILLSDKVPLNMKVDKEDLSVFILGDVTNTSKPSIQFILHYVPMTVLEKIYAKLDQAKEQFKKKLINQIMDHVSTLF